jgi:hypothetical protein
MNKDKVPKAKAGIYSTSQNQMKLTELILYLHKVKVVASLQNSWG